MENVVNYFDSRTAAELYARGRPYFHEVVMGLIRDRLGLAEPLPAALDVGCGTGLSTRVLRQIANRVVGVDVSAEMVAQAEAQEGVEYRVGPAEAMPVPDAAFDLATVSSAFHWLDRPRFFAEARRVLKPGGHLVIYENGFQGVMQEEPDFRRWVEQVHLAHYPSPPRLARFDPKDGLPGGFSLVDGLPYENAVAMTLPRLVDYLLTQSNAIAVMESGRETPEQARAFLASGLAPFFGPDAAGTRRLLYRGVVWILRCDAGLR